MIYQKSSINLFLVTLLVVPSTVIGSNSSHSNPYKVYSALGKDACVDQVVLNL